MAGTIHFKDTIVVFEGANPIRLGVQAIACGFHRALPHLID